MSKKIKNIFLNSPFKTVKHSSYFYAYEELFSDFVDKKLTFVEVGILNGGSLFMWKNYFGKKARIIGIDNNPNSKSSEKFGFEIHIGNQADPNFWSKFHKKVGKIDILLDDGGHFDIQQATTLFENINYINDGGLIVIEDTHASYLKKFGNPNKKSFMNLVFNLTNKLNYRSGVLGQHNKKCLKQPISQIRIFESICAFKIDRGHSSISKKLENNGKNFNIKDLRYENTSRKQIDKFYLRFNFLKKIPFIGKILKYFFVNFLREKIYILAIKKERKKIEKYFF